MSDNIVICPLCHGAGRFDDIECPYCDRAGWVPQSEQPAVAVSFDGDQAQAASHPRAGRGPERPVPSAPRERRAGTERLRVIRLDDALQAEYVRGYADGHRERRDAAEARGYAAGCAAVAALHLEQRSFRRVVAAVLVAFLVGAAALPTIAAAWRAVS